MGFIVFLAILAVLAFCGLRLHRGLSELRARVDEAWCALDALVVQRHEELLQLLQACRQSSQPDPQLLDRLQKARVSVFAAAGRRDVAALGAAESLLRDGLDELSACSAPVPPGPWARVAELGDRMSARREDYNAAVNVSNVRSTRWPGRLVARVSGPGALALLEFTG